MTTARCRQGPLRKRQSEFVLTGAEVHLVPLIRTHLDQSFVKPLLLDKHAMPKQAEACASLTQGCVHVRVQAKREQVFAASGCLPVLEQRHDWQA